MPRPLRIEAAGMWYHIMNRGVLRKAIFECDKDYQKFLENIDDSCGKYNVEIHSYALMPNHFHFFLKTNEANISRFMQQLLTSYTNWFNRKNERVGHLFQSRYKSIIIDNNNYGTEITRYIHLNPVRTKKNSELSLREKRKILENYRWSSYPSMIGIKPADPFLFVHETLECFGDNYKEQIRNYIEFVEEGLKKDLKSPLKDTISQLVLGDDVFVKEIKSMLNAGNKIERSCDIEVNNTVENFISYPIYEILEMVSKEYNVDIQTILTSGKMKRNCEARQITFYLASKYCVGNITLNKIGEIMRCKNGDAVSKAVKRFKYLMGKDNILFKKVKQFEENLNIGIS